MRVGSELRPRMTLRVDGTLCRVITADYHGGQGKMGGVMHAKLHDLQTGKEREQVAIDEARLGKAAAWLEEETVVPVELVDGEPLGIVFPRSPRRGWPRRRSRTTLLAPPTSGRRVTVMAPPFIDVGELVRVDVETGRYGERAKAKGR